MQSFSVHFCNLRVTKTINFIWTKLILKFPENLLMVGVVYLLPILRVGLNFCYNDEFIWMQTTILTGLLLQSLLLKQASCQEGLSTFDRKRKKNLKGLCFHYAWSLFSLRLEAWDIVVVLLFVYFSYDKEAKIRTECSELWSWLIVLSPA